MIANENSERYNNLSIALHWLMAILMIAVYAAIELRELYPKGSDPREALKALHFMLGLTVLLMVIVRIGVRLRNATPMIQPALPMWQQQAAHIMHGLLYALMILMPLGGWLMLSAAGKPIPFFGLELPPLMGKNKDLADTIKEIHETVGTIGYGLIGLHVAAGLFHHYVQRDNTLLRMLPQAKKNQ